jgi:hypothetical protein
MEDLLFWKCASFHASRSHWLHPWKCGPFKMWKLHRIGEYKKVQFVPKRKKKKNKITFKTFEVFGGGPQNTSSHYELLIQKSFKAFWCFEVHLKNTSKHLNTPQSILNSKITFTFIAYRVIPSYGWLIAKKAHYLHFNIA